MASSPPHGTRPAPARRQRVRAARTMASSSSHVNTSAETYQAATSRDGVQRGHEGREACARESDGGEEFRRGGYRAR
eukprot:5998251-Prymnesium_polylepis.2